ncbi:hypothetical protein [Streptomyces sp. NPDC059802]
MVSVSHSTFTALAVKSRRTRSSCTGGPGRLPFFDRFSRTHRSSQPDRDSSLRRTGLVTVRLTTDEMGRLREASRNERSPLTVRSAQEWFGDETSAWATSGLLWHALAASGSETD